MYSPPEPEIDSHTKPHLLCNSLRARLQWGKSVYQSRSVQTKDYAIGICWFSNQ